jgi:hypothetical protein
MIVGQVPFVFTGGVLKINLITGEVILRHITPLTPRESAGC